MPERAEPARMGPRSIQFRIVAAFLAALTAMGVSVGYLVAQQRPVADSLTLVAEGYLPFAKQVAQLKQAQDRVKRDLQRINQDKPRPVTGRTSAAEIYTEELRDDIEEARYLAHELQALPLDAQDRFVLGQIDGYLRRIEENFAAYEAQSSEYLQRVDEGQKDEAKDQLRKPLWATGKKLADEFANLEKLIEDRIKLLTGQTRELQARTTAISITLATIAALLSLLLVLAVLYALRPIGQLTAEVQRLAAGDYGGRVEVGGNDEVGLLAEEFNKMASAIELRDTRLKERARELRRLSRYLASVVDSLEDALLVVESGKVTLCNPAAARDWGAEVEAPPPESLRAMLDQPGLHELEGELGQRYSVRTVPFGEYGAVAVASDVTEQVRAREALARSERLALVGQMLAQITHEVRNPLNALSLNAELLGDELEELDPGRATEAWDLLAMIAREVERLTSVTGHYLQLARRPPARLAAADLRELVEEVARLLEPELDAHGVALALDLRAHGLQLVDGNQLRQALLNVVRNAVEAGARHLTLSLEADAAEVVFALSDDGPGMDAEQIDRAFDPFFSTKATGTGLGLAITRQILEDHGGSVRVDSAPGRGTTIALVLPSRPTVGDDRQEPAQEEARA